MAGKPNVPAGWLEVHDGEGGSHTVDCSRRGTLPRGECFGCKDCGGPTLDRSGQHVYVACEHTVGTGTTTV